MTTPGPWQFALLSLGAFRAWRLLARDSILDTPRDALAARSKLADDLLGCPWCLGFWVAYALYASWLAWPVAAEAVATVLAVSAAVGVLATVASD